MAISVAGVLMGVGGVLCLQGGEREMRERGKGGREGKEGGRERREGGNGGREGEGAKRKWRKGGGRGREKR